MRSSARWYAAGVLCAAASVTALAPAPPPLQPEQTASTVSALSVESRASLIDVALLPGEVHVAEAALSNTAEVPLSVVMTAVVEQVDGSGAATSQVRLSSWFDDVCTDDARPGSGSTPLGSVRGTPVGTLSAQEDAVLCTSITLPEGSTLPSGTTVAFAIVFDGFERPTASAPAERPLVPVLVVGVALLGSAVYLSRRRETLDSPLPLPPVTREDLS